MLLGFNWIMSQYKRLDPNKKLQAYIIGVALGDGNLSNPNGRAVRLRVTCDKKYPILLHHIASSMQKLFPDNKVSLINRKVAMDVSIYSNQLTNLLGYTWSGGPKNFQNVGIPIWIKKSFDYTKECLRGLFQTDGSIYNDRGYVMINFTNTDLRLVADVFEMMTGMGYQPNIQKIKRMHCKMRYTIRLCKNASAFIQEIQLWKQ